MQAQQLPIDQIHDNPLQPRLALDEEVIAGARAAIADAGAYPATMAILVRPRAAGGYEIIAGHHRTAAARAAGVATVWAHVQDLDDRAAAIALATTNNQAAMSPLEHAKHALLLKERHGVTNAEYARMVGKSQAAIEMGMAAMRVLAEHGGITGPNADLPVSVLATLRGVDDAKRRAALIYQFRTRRTTTAQAQEVTAHLRAGLGMREAFDRAEGRVPKEPAPRTGGNPGGHAAGAASSVASHLNNEALAGWQWTLAVYGGRLEEMEARFGKPADEAFLDAAAKRQQRILRELRADPTAKLQRPPSTAIACASCAHGQASSFADSGWTCAAGRARDCAPLTTKRFWVSKDEDGDDVA